MISVAAGKMLLAKTTKFFYEKLQYFFRILRLAAGGEPSTRFPPGGLVEPAGIAGYSELHTLI